MKDDTTFSKVKNLGVPVNSEKDDFALSTDSFGKVGYIQTERVEREMMIFTLLT